MTVIDHGVFDYYTPDLSSDDPLKGAAIVFSRNQSGDDWYAVRSTLPPGTYCILNGSNDVLVAENDVSRVFPADGRRLVQVTPTVPDPHGLVRKRLDLSTGVFADVPVDTQPVQVSPAQAKLALYNAGLLDQVEGLVSAAPTPVRIFYESAGYWTRSNPYIAAIAAELGLTDQQVDDLFAAAALL